MHAETAAAAATPRHPAMNRAPYGPLRGSLAALRAGVCAALLAAVTVSPALGAPHEVLGLWEDALQSESLSPFAHVNPDAPKGGRLRLSAIGTFDSFNPFSPRGVSAAQLGLTHETLGVSQRGTQEFIMRGLLAESFDLSPDRSTLRVRLRPQASRCAPA